MIQIIPTSTHTTITMPQDLFRQLETNVRPIATYIDDNTTYVYISLSNPEFAEFEAFLTRERILPL